ncbi:DUF803-domain-containing protein [Phellopilus nigrolimitatus]|nr:DUF803-domain-containing protein [Phellopilus nigrolimitatus]
MSSSSSPSQYRTVGIILAVGSGLLIGTSFVFKKKGLLKSQAGHAAGEGVRYLKSPMWWTGMTMMICGELCNFGAYAFVEAIVVTPLGALSVVISAILSHLILKEKLTIFGWIGCTQCILGAIIIALNGPEEQSVSTIDAFKDLFLAPWFLAYGGVCIAVALTIVFFVAPKYGTKSMIWYILVCSLIGGISVSCTQGLGACILTSIRGENQFKNWFIYFLMFFVVCTLLTEIYYLNVALALFNTAMVTPTYYVLFTFFTLVTSVILYQGLKAAASTIVTIALAFLVICSGIFILQMSKIDPRHLTKLDRKTTMLLQAAREEIRPAGADGSDNEPDSEKLIEATEEPGMDALAGRFGGIGGSIVRARRRATIQTNQKYRKSRRRVDTTASAPGPSLTRPSTQSRFSDASTGMDSVHARQLHELWREEREGKRDPGDRAYVQVVPADMRAENGKLDRWRSVNGLPFPSGKAGKGHILSDEPLVSSPVGTPTGELHNSYSVHFCDQPIPRGCTSPVQDINAASRRSSTSTGSHTVVLPASPSPALVPTSNTSLPSLHLTIPSLQIPTVNPLSRGPSIVSSSSDSCPSPILESVGQGKEHESH